MAAQVDEKPFPGETAVESVQRFAREKALAIAQSTHSGVNPVVLGADTIVVLDGQVFGKPVDNIDAISILTKLRGKTHRVYTALSLAGLTPEETQDIVVGTPVPMRQYTDEEIIKYVESGDPMDKAGAYAIQNGSFRPVLELNGCFANVMGLPLCHLTFLLRKAGLHPPVDVPGVCQHNLNIECPIYTSILAGEFWSNAEKTKAIPVGVNA